MSKGHVRAVQPGEAMVLDVRVRAEILEAAKKQLDMAVLRARGAEISWERIAEAVGISRQSAQERFGKLVEDGATN